MRGDCLRCGNRIGRDEMDDLWVLDGKCPPCRRAHEFEVRRAKTEPIPGIERSFTVDDLMATPGGRELVTRDVIAPRQARIENLLAE